MSTRRGGGRGRGAEGADEVEAGEEDTADDGEEAGQRRKS